MFSFNTLIEFFKYNKALDRAIRLLQKNLKSNDSFCFTSKQISTLHSDFRLVQHNIKTNKKLYRKLHTKLNTLTNLMTQLDLII